MIRKGAHSVTMAGVLAAALALASPGFAGPHGGGGGGHVGAGGGGGGHAGGGHVGGGGHSFGGAHAAGGAHFVPSSHFAGVAHGGSGARVATASRGFAAGAAAGAGYAGHTPYGYPGGGYRHGYSTGAYWGGGYWHGGYWPRAHYGYGFAWFLPILPLAYATYWYDGLPYYYVNDVYYTWNPDYSGYTATDPPPVTESGAPGDGSAVPPPGAALAGAGVDGSAQIFMYPKNGQSEQQQSADKRACQEWAAAQAGAQNASDYRRAMIACVEGRGYSAQ